MKAAAAIEWRGVPIDVPTFTAVEGAVEDIETALIADIDRDYGVTTGHRSGKSVLSATSRASASRGRDCRAASSI